MKHFVTLLVFGVAAVLIVGVLCLCQYLSFFGPEWVTTATKESGNGLAASIGGVLILLVVVSTALLLDAIWQDK